MSFVMDLDVDTFIGLIGEAQEKDLEQRLWEKWLAELPNMNQENFIPFEEYVKKHKKVKHQETKSDEQILQDAENILKSLSR